jgi:hypothetical protein
MGRGKSFPFLRFASLCWLLTACGTQDYESPPKTEKRILPVLPVPVSSRAAPSPPDSGLRDSPLIKRVVQPGYLFRALRWMGVSPDTIASWTLPLEDRPGVNHFGAFGTSVTGGAIIGVLVRYSGSWFLGRPSNVKDGPWVWERLRGNFANAGKGLLRGALYGGLCETALAGGNLTPLDGILGQNFTALSAAISLGTLSSAAAGPLARRWVGKIPTPAQLKKLTFPTRGGSLVLRRLRYWSQTHSLGRAIRYRLVPGLSIVIVGSGVGFLIYEKIQSGAAQPDVEASSLARPDVSSTAQQ